MNRQLPVLSNMDRPVKPTRMVCESLTEAARTCLQESGYTQRALAQHIGVDESYLSRMLSGERPWTDDVLTAITRRTGCGAIVQFQASRHGWVAGDEETLLAWALDRLAKLNPMRVLAALSAKSGRQEAA